ncbi:MAG: hypothetical protein HY435_01500 [Candidatus Liptonbacteria bacterium]|nr:hypothetical protein [Candidatus Liptonbacteria bacterium]
MNRFFARMLTAALKSLARRVIARYRPGIIGITGSVGKTSAKYAVHAVLSGERRVRISRGNLNSELGIALTVLGEWRERDWKLVTREEKKKRMVRKAIFWKKVLVLSALRLLFPKSQSYPEILILEYGVDRPGDMKALLEIAEPNIGIVTAIGEVPVHIEFFHDHEELVREKSRLIEHLPAAGFAILNADDPTVMDLANRTRAHLAAFGFGKGAEVQIARFGYRNDGAKPRGISFTLRHGREREEVAIDGAFGKPQAYSAAAAAAVGLIFGIPLSKAASALRGYRPPSGRMNILPGVKGTMILDDSYNASPLSMHAALDTLRDLPGKRKIAVLGDMLEIGKYAMEAHERVGRLAANVVDMLITVGPRAKFIADAAVTHGFSKKKVLSFDIADDARIPTQDTIKEGDLILIKGSRAMELEKVVEEIKMR